MIDVQVTTADTKETFTLEDGVGMLCFSIPENMEAEGSEVNVYANGNLSLQGIENVAEWAVHQLLNYFMEAGDEDELGAIMAEVQAIPLYAIKDTINAAETDEAKALVGKAWLKMQQIIIERMEADNGSKEQDASEG